MRDPAELARRHPRYPGTTCAAWALEILVIFYSGRQTLSQRGSTPSTHDSFSDESLTGLRRRGIGTRLQSFGADWRRFETSLQKRRKGGHYRNPIVRLPSTAEIDWESGSLRIHARTFLVVYEESAPIFLTREPKSRRVLRVTLQQMRLLHQAWREWPVVLPSMLLNVLWHWPLHD